MRENTRAYAKYNETSSRTIIIEVNFGSDEGELFISRFSDKFPVKRNNGESFLGINIDWTYTGDCILNV